MGCRQSSTVKAEENHADEDQVDRTSERDGTDHESNHSEDDATEYVVEPATTRAEGRRDSSADEAERQDAKKASVDEHHSDHEDDKGAIENSTEQHDD